MNWFISPPLGGMRTIGATAGASVPDLQDLRAVEHVLHAVAQLADVVGVVLHLEDDAVIGGGADRLRRADLGRGEGDKGRLFVFERADRGVEAGEYQPLRHSFAEKAIVGCGSAAGQLAYRQNWPAPSRANEAIRVIWTFFRQF